MTQVKNQKKWLAVTSFVLSLVWLLLSITIVWAIIWIPIIILWLIFGFIALAKKQKKWLAIAWTIISWLALLITSIFAFFFIRHYDEIVWPITEIAQMMKEDPELAVLMTNEQFAEEFQSKFQEVLIQKFWTEQLTNDWESVENLAVPTIMEEMKNVLYQLKDEYYQK